MSIGPTFSFAVVLFVHVVAYSVYPRAAQAQIVMQVTSEPVLAPAISAYSPDVPAKDRTEIRDALLTFPFQLPERMSARVARGDTTALLVVAVEAIRATHVPRSFPLAKAYFEQACCLR